MARPSRHGSFADKSRGNRHARGYGTAWEKLRLIVLKRDCYLCQCPECEGGVRRVRAAQEVDHRIPKAWFLDGRATGNPDDLTNLRAVSSECHRRISLEQRGHKRRPRIGLDGYPIDDE
jgi:5-methylcytosine-specific restriction protein A